MKINRRAFLKSSALAGTSLFTKNALAGSPSASNPRNVLLIMVDDLNLALSSWGHPAAHTPNVARLANRGVRFSHAFCPYPLCGPSRTALLTGRRPESFPMGTNEVDWRARRPDIRSLSEIARQNGLRAHRYGKINHQGMPLGSDERKATEEAGKFPNTFFDRKGWDYEFGREPNFYEDRAKGPEWILSGTPHGGSSLHTMRVTNPEVLPDFLVADNAVNFLQSSNAKEPFFLGVGFNKPHVPLFAPIKDWDRYSQLNAASLMAPSSKEPPTNLPSGALLRDSFHRGVDKAGQEHVYRGYLASVTWMDQQLGRVLDALDESGQADNTLIVFVADHGYHLGEQGHWDKMMLFEPSLRVPLIFAGAGVPEQGKVCDNLVESLDVFPTICNLMGWDSGETEGTDLTPSLHKPDRLSDRNTFAWVNAGPREGWSIRTATHRYSVMSKNGNSGAMLFDLKSDPYEMNNLAGSSAHVSLENQLRDQLRKQYSNFP